MKNYLLAIAVLTAGLIMSPVSGVSLAQEEEDMEYSYGTVSSISPSQIVVREYDYESDEEIDVTYAIDANTELNNVGSLKEISVGDDVDIDYIVVGDKRVAKLIAVEKAFSE